MKTGEPKFLSVLQVITYVILVTCAHDGFSESSQSSTISSVTSTLRVVGPTAFITEWRWIANDRNSVWDTWGPGPRLDHAFFSYKGDQWIFGGHINTKNYSDLWLANGSFPWTRIASPADLVQERPARKAGLCESNGVLALYPSRSDKVWLLDINDNVWTSFVCVESSIVNGNETKSYCPGDLGRDAMTWCDVQEGRMFVLAEEVAWSFSLSSPHWLSHVILKSDVEALSRCESAIHAGLTEGEKSGLYLLCSEDVDGARSILRLKMTKKGLKLDDVGSLTSLSGNATTLGMTVAYCDEIVALVIAQEDDLPVWVIDNDTGYFVKTGNSWVGNALKRLHVYSAVDYTVTCAGNSYRLRNPRVQPDVTRPRKEKYWSRERGSFQMSLIELGELIKVDQDGLHLYHHRTATEALVFFALCLLIFLTIGVAWFFKRCVTIPVVPRGWPGSWGRSTGPTGAGDCIPTARYTPIPRGEGSFIT